VRRDSGGIPSWKARNHIDRIYSGEISVMSLALFFIKREMETHYDVDNRSDLGFHC
jgi:hypothetical protein